MKGEIVLVESPYNGTTIERYRNLRYLAWCEFHSLTVMQEYPIASHGNCTAYLPEDPESRRRGFEWRNHMARIANRIVGYVDRGQSSGMLSTFELDLSENRIVEIRTLPPDLFVAFRIGAWPQSSMRRLPIGIDRQPWARVYSDEQEIKST